ncbi:MAG: bifunctional histidinol-phosphatase/imidazoleglycerol-phosphate dehydratase HisB [Rikenellaceae bacterium]|nr:bifunctional histidinol-phosphatase/imidazoleglycerol-phosphate dehydratase HisB [Rikenellaceae bacterium]MCL2692969.1 bifunctional histidinol-phosphatase/imidazoleglycerol-phosphate dehydratase HisB [Rikenellaceae bacterium]
MKKKILFLDRDGTVLREPPVTFQIDHLDKFEFMPGAITALARLAAETDYRMVMVSNQDGLGTRAFPREDFAPLHDLMLRTLAGEGVNFDEVLIDESFPEQSSPTRKPRTGLVDKYLNELLDRENSYVIGDRATDMQLAANMGIRGILLGDATAEDTEVALHAATWDKICRFLILGSRRARVERRTSETDIVVEIDLNGSGCADISTGLGFFDHMLEQIARHAGIDLMVRAKGDLHIDEHHTIEDTALALGECLRSALGSKKGIGRYGFALPMDESRAEMLLDLGGRPCLVWDADFDREYAGDFPTDMTRHFFSSFCHAAGCNLHVRASGENTHHTIEVIFKAFARALRDAVKPTDETKVPSSKGTL